MRRKTTSATPQGITYSLYIGTALLLGLNVLAFVYWRERVIFADAAYQVFSVVDQQAFAIQVQRFGAALVQAPALLLSRLGAPLLGILPVYSLTFTVYPLLYMLLIWRGVRQRELALLVVFFFLLLQVHTFFWIQSELIQGCMLAILTISVMLRTFRPKPWQWLLWQALLLTLVYIHPLAILPFLFLWAWYAWARRDELNYAYLSVLLSVGVLLVYRYFLGQIDQYDQAAMSRTSGFIGRIVGLHHLESTRFFARALLSTYYPFALIGIATAATLAYRKVWVPLWLMLAGAGGWLFLVLVTYYDVTDLTYIESYYLPLGIMVGLPFIQHVYRQLPLRWALLLMTGLSVFRIGQIIDLSPPYTQRADWVENIWTAAQQHPEQRFYLIREELPNHFIKLDWALAYEMMLLSGAAEMKPGKTVHVVSESAPLDFLHLQDAFPTGIGDYGYERLNPRYFVLDDSLPVRRLQNR